MLAEVRAPGKASRFSPAEKTGDARTGIAATKQNEVAASKPGLPRRFAHRGWQASAIWRGARYFVYNRWLMLSQEPAE